jgi:hypothetical protein
LRSRVEELQLRLEAARNGSSTAQTQQQQPQPAWARWRRVEDFPRDRLLFVSFSNGHYADLMMNWVQTLRVLEVLPGLASTLAAAVTLSAVIAAGTLKC